MAHEHSIYDCDTHFVIDPVTRQIKNESGKTVIVQNDHNSERFTCELPRTVEGHDMSACDKVEVLYENVKASDKTKHFNRYIVTDFKIDPEDESKVILSWLITDDATQNVGNLNFSVRFYCETNFVWNTAIFSEIKVIQGMPKTSDMVASPEEELAEIENLIDESGVIERDNNL